MRKILDGHVGGMAIEEYRRVAAIDLNPHGCHAITVVIAARDMSSASLTQDG